MALLTKLSTAAVQAQATALATMLANGYLRMYTASRPATPDTPITDQVTLAALRFQDPAASSIVDGVITFVSLLEDSSAPTSGTATWFRCYASDGATPILDGNIGVSGADINMNPSTAILSGAPVQVNSLVHRVPKS